jgi:predicted lipoprotein with Yx(FWY)xxD motif
MRNKSSLLAIAPVAAAVIIAGCGGTSYGGGGATGGAATGGTATGGTAALASTKATSNAATVDLATSNFGKILVDNKGRTLYLFAADKSTMSTCSGACASLWPPLTVSGTPKAGTGVTSSLLGTTKRGGGSTEVTYAGHPLYYYAGDTAAGQTTGQDISQFGAKWFVLTASGTEITHG